MTAASGNTFENQIHALFVERGTSSHCEAKRITRHQASDKESLNHISQTTKNAALFLPKPDPYQPPSAANASVHEQPLAGRYDHLAAHGALAQLLATLAVAANHVATGHEDHGWAVLVANGTCHAGPA